MLATQFLSLGNETEYHSPIHDAYTHTLDTSVSVTYEYSKENVKKFDAIKYYKAYVNRRPDLDNQIEPDLKT